MAVAVKKVYPIKGRRDFFKYVVMVDGKIARGYQHNQADQEMYFNQKVDAQRVAGAIRRVNALRKKHSTSKTSKK